MASIDPVELAAIQRHCARPDKLTLLALVDPPRPYVRLFVTKLEYTHYDPFTKAINDLFEVFIVHWEGMMWWVVTIPVYDRTRAETMATELGLKFNPGIPLSIHELEVTKFPIQGPRVFTLETNWTMLPDANDPAHLTAEAHILADMFAKQEAEIRRRLDAGERPGPEWKEHPHYE